MALRNPLKNARSLTLALGGAAMVMWSGVASAVSVEIVEINSYYGFSPGDGTGAGSQAGRDQETFYTPSSTNGRPSELGIDYTSYANSNSFFFLHQDYCIGTCSTFSATQIFFRVTNDSDTETSFRFDSFITPGHMTLLAPSQGTLGSFDFYVSQTVEDSDLSLYRAGGTITPDGISLLDGAQAFSGLTRTTLPSGAEVVDWGATPLNLSLTLAPNSSSFLTYSASYYVQNTGVCDLLETCSSAEIVFGDPRNEGGVTPLRSANPAATAAVIEPWAGGAYAPTALTFNVVDRDAPLPTNVPSKPLVTYVPVNRPNADPIDGPQPAAVPEPGSWAMMLAGFGSIGTAMRRQQRRSATMRKSV